MIAFDPRDTRQTIQAVQEGIPAQVAAAFRDQLGLSWADLADALLTGERTLQRRLRSQERLPPDVSDRLAEQLRLLEHAEDVLGNETASRWLTTPHAELDGLTPLYYARTSAGRRFVHDLLAAIQHGFAV